MEKRTIGFGFLSYTMQPILMAMTSVSDEINEIINKTGWTVIPIVRTGSGLVSHVRNSIVAEAMELGCDEIIMMDDDNYPDHGGILKLLLADVDVVGIPVRSRCEEMRWNVRWNIDDPVVQRDDRNGLIEVESVGTGIIRIKRSVIEKMIAADPEDWYWDDSNPTGKAYDIFKIGSKNHFFVGEDVYFCRRWRELGGKVWIEPDTVSHHFGIRDHADSVTRWLMQDMAPQFDFSNVTSPKPIKMVNDFSVLRLPEKSVAMVIASRGDPAKLYRTIINNLKGRILEGTKIIVGLDEDDKTLGEAQGLLESFPEAARKIVTHVVGPREDSIGAVYNRCVKAVPADVYINGADDVVITTKGWDARILKECEKFPDGIGVVGIGKMPVKSILPALSAVTRPMIDQMGYFMQDHTPYWWMDTWLYEIAVMIRRQLPLDMVVECEDWARTRGMREVDYWAKFFDEARPVRRRIAERILRSFEFKSDPSVIRQALNMLDDACKEFEHSNSILRDPDYAAKIMSKFAHEAHHDDRYERIKARSLAFLEQSAAA